MLTWTSSYPHDLPNVNNIIDNLAHSQLQQEIVFSNNYIFDHYLDIKHEHQQEKIHKLLTFFGNETFRRNKQMNAIETAMEKDNDMFINH